jgi:hypothetical protein
VCRAVAEAKREAEDAQLAARIAAEEDGEGSGADSDEDSAAFNNRRMAPHPPPSIGYGIPIQQPALVPVPLNGYPGYPPPQHQMVPPHPQPQQQQPQYRNPLPPDFLRFPGVGVAPLDGQARPGGSSGTSGGGGRRSRGGSTSTSEAQLASDEAMAAMLQNELFLQQVREDPELADFIRRDPRGAAALGLPVHLILPALQAQDAAMAQQQQRRTGGMPSWFSGTGGSVAPPSSSTGTAGAPGGEAVNRPTSAGTSGSSSGGIFTSMQRRLDTLAARFRKNQKVGVAPAGAAPAGSGSTAQSSSSTSASSSWFGAGRKSGYLSVGGGAAPNTAAGPASPQSGALDDDEDDAGDEARHEPTHTASSGARASVGGGGRRISSARQPHSTVESGAVEIELTDAPGAIGGGSSSSSGGLGPGSLLAAPPRNAGAGSIDIGPVGGSAARRGQIPAAGPGAKGGLVKPSAALGPSPFAIDDDEEETEDENAALTGGGRTV